MFGALGAPDSAPPLAEIGIFDCSNGGCSSPVPPIILIPAIIFNPFLQESS